MIVGRACSLAQTRLTPAAHQGPNVEHRLVAKARGGRRDRALVHGRPEPRLELWNVGQRRARERATHLELELRLLRCARTVRAYAALAFKRGEPSPNGRAPYGCTF